MSKSRVHYSLVILLMGVLVVMGALGFARFGYTMILPSMRQGLGLSNTQMGLLATGNFVGYLVFALLGGFLASRFGPRLVITLSMTLAGATMFLTGAASSFGLALSARTLTGVGSGGSNVPVMGLASAWFAPKRRGMATGILVTGSSLGLLITGGLVPRIIARCHDLGWRYSWYILGIAVVALAILAYALLRNRPEEKGLTAIGLDDDAPPPTRSGASSLQWGLVYRSRPLWQLAGIYFMFGFSYIIYATFFATYLVDEGGLTQGAAGALWSLVGLVSIVSSFIWGAASDLWGRRIGLALVYGLQGLSFLVFAVVRSTPGYYASALLFALTAWSIPAIMAAACGDYLGPALAPAALGLITVVFGIGQAIGPYVGGTIADATGSFAIAFLLAALAAFAGATGSLLLRPPEGAAEPQR